MDFDASGNIYVVDQTNHLVQKFDSDGTFLSQFGSEGSGPGELSFPSDITLDSSGNIHVESSIQGSEYLPESYSSFFAYNELFLTRSTVEVPFRSDSLM
jgi:DNA-binding beta-propeller fold protein YncE